MSAHEWIVWRPADLVDLATDRLAGVPDSPDPGVAWLAQHKAAVVETRREVADLHGRMRPLIPGGTSSAAWSDDPRALAFAFALSLQASQRVRPGRSCPHAPLPGAEDHDGESRQVQRARRRNAARVGPRPITVILGAGIAGCRDCLPGLLDAAGRAALTEDDGRCEVCGSIPADNYFFPASLGFLAVHFIYSCCRECRAWQLAISVPGGGQ